MNLCRSTRFLRFLRDKKKNTNTNIREKKEEDNQKQWKWKQKHTHKESQQNLCTMYCTRSNGLMCLWSVWYDASLLHIYIALVFTTPFFHFSFTFLLKIFSHAGEHSSFFGRLSSARSIIATANITVCALTNCFYWNCSMEILCVKVFYGLVSRAKWTLFFFFRAHFT